MLSLKHTAIGSDHVFILTGGDEHIGAVATATWEAVACRQARRTPVLVHLDELAGHREGPLAAYCAQMAAFVLGGTVTVVAGIHIHAATSCDIEAIVEQAKRMMKEKLWSLLA